jgi:hypothetical protein
MGKDEGTILRVSVRGYEGVLARLESTVKFTDNFYGKASLELLYCVTILCNNDVLVKIDEVKPSEIKVIS